MLSTRWFAVRNTMDFADDVCILSQKISDMQEIDNNLVKLVGIVGLQINIVKSKAMRVNHYSRSQLSFGNHEIKSVDSFCYLGSTIKTEKVAFGRLQWDTSSQISRSAKLRTCFACVKSMLLQIRCC